SSERRARALRASTRRAARTPITVVNRAVKNVTSEGRLGATSAQEPQCTCWYMRIPSTARVQDAERSSFSPPCEVAVAGERPQREVGAVAVIAKVENARETGCV